MLNGLDPEAYLRDVLTRIADHSITASMTAALEHALFQSRVTDPTGLNSPP